MIRSKKLKTMVVLEKCRYCKSTENLTIDHKTPLCKGGKDEKKNLQCLCRTCNTTKSSLTHGEVNRYLNWFLWIQQERVKNGGKPYQFKEKKFKIYALAKTPIKQK